MPGTCLALIGPLGAGKTQLAKGVAEGITVGPPFAEGTRIGPVVSEMQWNKIQRLIQAGIDEGATLVTGGPGKPKGLEKGYYVRPTVFANVRNDMTIAREEIFGPVLSILPYQNDDDAARIANETSYGLAGYVSSGNLERARNFAKRLRAGQINLNGEVFQSVEQFLTDFGTAIEEQSKADEYWHLHEAVDDVVARLAAGETLADVLSTTGAPEGIEAPEVAWTPELEKGWESVEEVVTH